MNAPATDATQRLESAATQRCAGSASTACCAHAETLLTEPWLARVIEIEETERARRSLKRRLDNARLGAFKPIADFDWSWPAKCDRA